MNDSPATPATRQTRWVPVFLVILPSWLALSAAGALWYYFYQKDRDAESRQAAFAREISIASLGDDLRKFTTFIGERHTGEGEPALNLLRAASMIEGLLGPSNTGLEIRRIRGPMKWPLLETAIPAPEPEAGSIWIITGYDAPAGTRGGEINASGVAAVIAAIQAAANDTPDRHLRFLFLPHLHDTQAPVGETLRIAAETLTARGHVDTVMWVEAMGGPDPLQLRANQPAALPVDQLDDLGHAAPGTHGLESHAQVPQWLIDTIIRVSTREPMPGGDPVDGTPAPGATADAAGRLLELMRRLANKAS